MNAPAAQKGAPLRISYLFSQFPLPTQAFAVSDIAALRALGHEVIVHTMKLPRNGEGQRMEQAGLPGDLQVLRPAMRRVFAWPLLLFRRRAVAKALAGQILAQIGREPRAALIALLCLPRILEITEEIESLDCDIVHLFWSRYSALVLYALRHSGAAQLRSTFVGAYDLEEDDFLVQCAIDNAHTVFTHSESNQQFLAGRCGEDAGVAVIHRGIPLMPLQEDAPRDPKLWLTASALVKEKNVDRVIAAFARARCRVEGIRLAICGDGPERASLEQLAMKLGCADAVEFKGHVQREQVFALSERAWLFIMLSTKPSERLPNVIKEAMWGGCAIVASQTQGIEELIVDDAIGAVVDPADDTALDQAIIAALEEEPQLAENRRARARALIADRFSCETSMARYVEHWRAALNASQAERAKIGGS